MKEQKTEKQKYRWAGQVTVKSVRMICGWKLSTILVGIICGKGLFWVGSKWEGDDDDDDENDDMTFTRWWDWSREWVSIAVEIYDFLLP